MSLFYSNRIVEFLWLLLMFASVYLYLKKAERGEELPHIRIIPATLAIEEGVGRSLEMGRPVHYSMGSDGGPIMNSSMSTTIASLALLRYTTKLAAQYGTRMIVHLPSQGESIPLIEGVVREAYLEAGKPDAFQRGDLHYYGWLTAAFTPGVYESFSRDGVGLFMHCGHIITFSFPVLEAAKIHGAITIGGTPRWTASYMFAMACDQMFIGEDLLAAGAQVSENKILLSGLASEEIWKFVSIALIIGGSLLQAVGIDIAGLLGM
jgi:hypothetical protein